MDVQQLCEAAATDEDAMRDLAEAAWAHVPHSCGSGVALSPLWGKCEPSAERELVQELLGRAARGEPESRVLAGLIRGQAVRALILGSDEEEELQAALVGLLERGDKHALFALFILAALIIDEPLGAELFSRANVIQTFHWTVSIVTAECTDDPAAAQACLELLQMLATRTDLVDAIERHDDTAEQMTELARSLPAAPGAVGVLHTLAAASPALARELATALAASEGGAALEWLVETLRGGATEDKTAERMLLQALRADPAPAQSLLRALLAAEGGVAMLAALTEQVFDRSASQRTGSSSGSQQYTQHYSSQAQDGAGGTFVLTQELLSQVDEDEAHGSSEASQGSSSATGRDRQASGASTDLVVRYEAILAEERRSASMRMEAMASAAHAEQEALQAEVEGLQKHMRDKTAKHEARVEKLTEVTKRERERRVSVEGLCRRETDEAATSRKQLAGVKEELGGVRRATEEAERALRQEVTDVKEELDGVKGSERELQQELAGVSEELTGVNEVLADVKQELVDTLEEAKDLRDSAAADAAAWDVERQDLYRKLVVVTEGYEKLEQHCARQEETARHAERAAGAVRESHARQLEEAGAALSSTERRCARAEDENRKVSAELREAQGQVKQLNKVSALMAALVGTTGAAVQSASGPASAEMDSPSMHSNNGGSAGSSDGGSAELEEVMAFSQSDKTPHREVKAHLREAYAAEPQQAPANKTSGTTISLGGLQLPTWSQALPDESDANGTLHYGSQEPPPPHVASGSPEPGPTPRLIPAFEWDNDQDSANRDRRAAFLELGGAGGSVMANEKPGNRTDDDEEEENDGDCSSGRAAMAVGSEASSCGSSPDVTLGLALGRRDPITVAKSGSSREGGKSARRRSKLKLLRAETACTQPQPGDDTSSDTEAEPDEEGEEESAEQDWTGRQDLTPIKMTQSTAADDDEATGDDLGYDGSQGYSSDGTMSPELM